jgi:RNA polymerase sigma-54 factor
MKEIRILSSTQTDNSPFFTLKKSGSGFIFSADLLKTSFVVTKDVIEERIKNNKLQMKNYPSEKRNPGETRICMMLAIIDYQWDYFQKGDETKIKPMKLDTIAKMVGIDISVVSRANNSYSILTHFGKFPLNYFFSEGISTESGEIVSSIHVKKILKEIIEGEDKAKPMPDRVIEQKLQKAGYIIARRTISKYRGQLKIIDSRLRKGR